MTGGGEVWTGEWVARRLGVELVGEELRAQLGLALRRNPRRAHLLVSRVLGKHVPQRPAAVLAAGRGLGEAVRGLLGAPEAARAVVLGYAETATALGHCVADGLGGVPYLHSTRRRVPGTLPPVGFQEEHSHATGHLLLPADPALLTGDGPLVLVDDELSTGRTVVNTVAALQAHHPRERYVVASLVDVRTERDRAALAKAAADLGTRIDTVCSARGEVRLPPDVLARGAALVAAEDARRENPTGAGPLGSFTRLAPEWPRDLPDGGRHGFLPAHGARLDALLPGLAHRLAEAAGGGHRRVLVLGSEELMYLPLRLADALQGAYGPGTEVRYASTTRSPVLAVDDPGYAVRTRLGFPALDEPEGRRYVHNVAPGRDPARRYDAVVLVLDGRSDRAPLYTPGDGLLDRLRSVTPRLVLLCIKSTTPRLGNQPVAG